MDRERFEQLLAAYGADRKRWPEAERAKAAEFLLRHRGEVSTLQDEAAALDAALDEARDTPAPSPDLTARILAAAPPRRAQGFDVRAALALAACAVLGVLLGYGGARFAPAEPLNDDYLVMSFEAPFDGGAELDLSGDEG